MADAVATPALLRGVQRLHFVGIGGAGMCGLAEVLLAQGLRVSGSDLAASAATRRLAELGAEVHMGHAAANVGGAQLVVASSAIDAANAELVGAAASGIRVVARGALLAALMEPRMGIAVAGSHGKTTTAALIGAVLGAAGWDPTLLLGGTPHALGGNGRLGAGRHLVAEADESDASFLQLRPRLAVVTNLDRDHLDTYGQRFEAMQGAFADFLERLPAGGVAVLCADDAAASALPRPPGVRVITYGLDPRADVRAPCVAGGERGSIVYVDGLADRLALPLPGTANVRNALAAIAACRALGVPPAAIADGIEGFAGVQRRFQLAECQADGKRFTLVDDYGHHPTELAHIVDTVRERWPGRRLLMAFQPHRYTRTRDLLGAFAGALAQVDRLVLAEVYAASEAPIPGADGTALLRAVQSANPPHPPAFAATPAVALMHLRALIEDGDVVAVQGAGDIASVAEALRSAP